MSNEFNFENLLVRKEIFAVIETEDKEHPVEIYSPNKEQRKMILDLILKNLKTSEDKLTTNISGYDMIFKLLGELSNVKLSLDVNNAEHQERVKRIVEDPSDLFLDINTQLNKIINKQFYRYYDKLKEILSMPEDLREAYMDAIDKISQETEVKNEEDQTLKEIAELEAKLAALKEGK